MEPNISFAESCDHDLLVSKYWLCKNLPNKKYKNIFVLGSWYGNMGLVLRYAGIDFDCLYNIDTNPFYCTRNRVIYELAKFDRPYKILNSDCNKIDYSNADLVINTSTNDIKHHKWFEKIPKKCLIAIQCRNNQKEITDKDRPDSYSEFLDLFELGKILYKGKINLTNPTETYSRYMIIGKK